LHERAPVHLLGCVLGVRAAEEPDPLDVMAMRTRESPLWQGGLTTTANVARFDVSHSELVPGRAAVRHIRPRSKSGEPAEGTTSRAAASAIRQSRPIHDHGPPNKTAPRPSHHHALLSLLLAAACANLRWLTRRHHRPQILRLPSAVP